MSSNTKKILSILNPRKVWIPASIGIGFVVYMIFTDDNFSPERLNLIFMARIWPVVLAFVVVVIKEWAYIYRIRVLSGNYLSWTASSYIIFLWEFASAVTPSVVGGTPVAVFLMMKEGIKLGKSMAYAMLTAILDNVYLVVMAPILFFLMKDHLFSKLGVNEDWSAGLQSVFFISYGLVITYTVIMAFALFIKPRVFKWILIKITSIGFLKKWRYDAYLHGEEVMMASKELRGTTREYWYKVSGATFVTWTARFILLNILIMAYVDITWFDHFIAFGKNVALWIIMLASPTPGSSLAAELGFAKLFDVTLEQYTGAITIFWRLLTYYPFLIIGTLILPKWINRVFYRKKVKAVADEGKAPVE